MRDFLSLTLDIMSKKLYNNLASYECAGLAERSKAAVLKTVEVRASWGSNP